MLWSRPASLILPFVLAFAGCAYGNGSPCEAPSDCASGVCCGFAPGARGVCRAPGDTCVVAAPDTGVPEDTGVPSDATTDTGVDAATDSGSDAPTDSGVDASTDVGTDAPSDDDAGTEDTGVDAPA